MPTLVISIRIIQTLRQRLGLGGSVPTPTPPPAGYSLSPNPETANWMIGTARQFSVVCPSGGADVVVNAQGSNTLSVASAQANLREQSSAQRLSVSNGDTIYIEGFSTGRGRIEIGPPAYTIPGAVYSIVVGAEAPVGRSFGPRFGPRFA